MVRHPAPLLQPRTEGALWERNALLNVDLTPREILEVSEDFLNEDRFTHMCGDTVHGNKFIHELMDFIQSVAARASQERVFVGLDDGYYYSGYSDNGRRFQLDRAPAVMQKRLRQLPVGTLGTTEL